MRIENPYQCDECGRKKGEANRWWLLLNDLGHIAREDSFVLRTWESADPDSPTVKAHLCSEACATKALSKWMAQQGG